LSDPSGAANAADSGPQRLHAAYGGATPGADGPLTAQPTGAATFDGVDDGIYTTLDVDPTAMPSTTWSAWVRPTVATGSKQTFLSNDDGNWDRALSIEANGQYVVGVGNVSPFAWAPGPFA